MPRLPDNFMGLHPELADPETARFAVLPVPYDGTTSYMPGTRLGPRAIITASQQVEWFDPDFDGEFVDAGICTLAALEPRVDSPESMLKTVRQAAANVVRQGQFLVMLGGEHSLTSAAVSAVRKRHRKLSVLQIDAHADLRSSYEGSPWSHACVMRRLHEDGVPFIGVGIRSYSDEEARYMRRHDIRPVRPSEWHDTDSWIDRVVAALTETVYITVDIDGFDPAMAPGTGTPEPGGLDWNRFCRLLRAVARHRTIVAADVVETIPTPGTVVTEFLAARTAYKIISAVQVEASR
jgi:agmatinase